MTSPRWIVAIGVAASCALASACAPRGIAIVQRHHGREFSCNARFVEVERGEQDRYVSRGCGFEADWDCARGECALRDARAHGMSAP